MTYTETRYYKRDSSDNKSEYSTLIDNLTSIPSTNTYTIRDDIRSKFSFEAFKQAVLSEQNGLSARLPSGNESVSEYITALKSTNSSLREYYFAPTAATNSLTASDTIMMDIANKVIDYFVISSVMYQCIYGVKTGYTVALDMGDASSTKNLATFKEDATTQDFTTIIHLYKDSIDALNLTTEDYNKFVNTNIEYNGMFLKQDALLKLKEKQFNTEKSNVITLLSKVHKGNKMFKNQNTKTIIYLVVLMLYIVLISGLGYGAMTNTGVPGVLKSAMMGNMLIAIGAVVLSVVSIHTLRKMIYKL